MKTLFDENERLNTIAQALDLRLGRFLKIEFDGMLARGYSMRETAIICHNSVAEAQFESLIEKPSVDIRRED